MFCNGGIDWPAALPLMCNLPLLANAPDAHVMRENLRAYGAAPIAAGSTHERSVEMVLSSAMARSAPTTKYGASSRRY
jgi:hypothetical protein